VSAREIDAHEQLDQVRVLLLNHRDIVRARRAEPGSQQADENAHEHESITQALHRTCEALGWLRELPKVRAWRAAEAERDA
jgi:hypothetical protein